MGRKSIPKTPGRKLRQNACYQSELKVLIDKIRSVIPVEGLSDLKKRSDRFSNVKVLYCALNYIIAMNEKVKQFKVKRSVDIDLKFLKNISLQKVDIRDDNILNMCMMSTNCINVDNMTQTEDVNITQTSEEITQNSISEHDDSTANLDTTNVVENSDTTVETTSIQVVSNLMPERRDNSPIWIAIGESENRIVSPKKEVTSPKPTIFNTQSLQNQNQFMPSWSNFSSDSFLNMQNLPSFFPQQQQQSYFPHQFQQQQVQQQQLQQLQQQQLQQQQQSNIYNNNVHFQNALQNQQSNIWEFNPFSQRSQQHIGYAVPSYDQNPMHTNNTFSHQWQPRINSNVANFTTSTPHPSNITQFDDIPTVSTDDIFNSFN